MQLECNASVAGSLLFCCVCTKKCFLPNIFIASCKLFIVQRQWSSHRNCPYGFGKGQFHICTSTDTRNDGQHGQGKCCLDVAWKVTAWEVLCWVYHFSDVGRTEWITAQPQPHLLDQLQCHKKDLSVYQPAGELQEGEKEITLHLQYLAIPDLRQK